MAEAPKILATKNQAETALELRDESRYKTKDSNV